MLERVRSRAWRQSVLAELRAGPRAVRRTLPWAVRTRFGQVSTLLQVALGHAAERPGALAVEMGDRTLTWNELADRSSRVAHVLSEAGVRHGDVVAVLGQNSPFYIALILGVTRVGAKSALINTNLRGRPLAHAVKVSGARVAVVDHSLEQDLRNADDLNDHLDHVLVFGDGTMDAALAKTPSIPFPPYPVSAEDDFVYIYTSGTTGLPKPCRVSHARSVMAGASAGPLMFEFGPNDKLYCVLPLYHSSAMLLGVSTTIVAGIPIALRESFSASQFWPDVQRYRATAILYIGELCRYLVNTPPHTEEQHHAVRVAVGNGLRPDVWPEFQRRFGIPKIREFYGATEAPGVIVNLSGKQGSVGRVPLGGLGVLRLVKYDVAEDRHPRDAKGFCVPCMDAEVGELLIRLPKLATPGLEFRGYTDADATEKKIMRGVFAKGDSYFRSGDLLRRDSDGFYYFVDRIGDTFRWKGENVSTAEIADEIARSPLVDEVTVVGVQVPHMDGQAGLAAIVPVGSFDPTVFAKSVAQLPSYAKPVFVRVMVDLAKTGTFKLQKNQLRKEGIDPTAVDDPLFVRADDRYVPLTAARWQDLLDSKLRL